MINLIGYIIFTAANTMICGWLYWLLEIDLIIPAFLLGCALTCLDGFILDVVYRCGKSEGRKYFY